jgi:pimeloyl-ACP methyl ester carboxylesterase
MRDRPQQRIDLKRKITLGSVDQWISLRSEDVTNPMILFLHGGPGTAQISFARKPQRGLEKHFLVVNWDQRGAGRSYSRSLARHDMTIERFVLDAEELVEALLREFRQTQVFLVGHSWGSIIGAKLAAKRPDLVAAYVGIGQVVDMKRGEEISYQFTLTEAERLGNAKALRELQRIGHPPYRNLRDAGVQRKWLARLHGATAKGSPIGTLLRNLSLRDTRPSDIVRFIWGAMFSLSCLEEQQNEVNLQTEVPELEVPVCFCAGRRDYNVPFELVVEYLQSLRAPRKEIVWFERSGHLPNFEEAEKFCGWCVSLLTRPQGRADGHGVPQGVCRRGSASLNVE